MTIIYAIPMFILGFAFFYFLLIKSYLISIFFLILFLVYILLSEYLLFFSYAILFRNKLYLDSYKYSYELVKDNFGRTLLLGFYFTFKTFLVLLGIIILSLIFGVINVFLKSEIIYFIGDYLSNLILLLYTYLFTIFSINYFLALEKEKGFSKDFDKDLNKIK